MAKHLQGQMASSHTQSSCKEAAHSCPLKRTKVHSSEKPSSAQHQPLRKEALQPKAGARFHPPQLVPEVRRVLLEKWLQRGHWVSSAAASSAAAAAARPGTCRTAVSAAAGAAASAAPSRSGCQLPTAACPSCCWWRWRSRGGAGASAAQACDADQTQHKALDNGYVIGPQQRPQLPVQPIWRGKGRAGGSGHPCVQNVLA